MVRALIIALFALVLAVQSGAQEPGAGPTPEPTAAESQTPDYSRPALRFIFRDVSAEDQSGQEPAGLAFERYGWVFRWVPIMGEGVTNDGAFGATPSQPVDPFYMLNVSFPATARTAPAPPDGRRWNFSERRYRRRMLSVTAEENEKENRR